ncbi:MAG: RNA degradosome polyphosphate kinase [Lentisphaerae bacterium RIFOXYC12_FULL_60_16]|nr:MAG: RNA degradosome polyphosphate kinase [Lentisphaerae bacterium RIFOXYC12_FULL_60_16]
MAKVDVPVFNRELSWLEFNQRVLEEAKDESVPLMERVKFLAITASNLDEFFLVRVGSLVLLVAEGVTRSDASGLSPAQQLEAVVARVRTMVTDQYAVYTDLEQRLRASGMACLSAAELSPDQLVHAENVFDDEVFPVLSPVAIPAGTPFPALPGQSLNLAVRLKPAPDGTEPRYAVIPLPGILSRFIRLPGQGEVQAMIRLEDLTIRFIDRLFPGEPVVECVPFRITRNAAMGVEEDQSNDFLAEMTELLKRRKAGDCIRIETVPSISRMLLRYLQRGLQVPDTGVYEVSGPLNLAAWFQVAGLNAGKGLRYESWEPRYSPQVDLKQSVFDTLARRSVLLCHPYDSYEPVLRFIEDAAVDPGVLAIKQTLYRTSPDSRVMAALRRAAERGKSVTALVELKARFDEARNIEWAHALELSGVQVIYGVKGLKTHSKICLVVRRESTGIVRYLHLGTGNYNERTARMYSDISLLTSNADLGADASAFFHAVTGYTEPPAFLKLAMAPLGLRERLLERIESETERARQGQPAMITAKMNSLVDERLIEALYRASQAGVQVRLNVRGICCLRPGLKNSASITVVSVVDRYLEHARIFRFHAGGQDDLFISSADWMPRNLDRRVELLVPVDDEENRAYLTGILEAYYQDNVKAWRLLPDGRYVRLRPETNRKAFRSQEVLYRRACEAAESAEQLKPTVLEPHRPPTARGPA